jgi:hypothetical protein
MSNQDCPICLETTTLHVGLPTCDHTVCRNCWPELRDTQSACPLCRKPFSTHPTFTINTNYHRARPSDDAKDVVIILFGILALIALSSLMFVNETCMCHSGFRRGETVMEKKHWMGGSTLITRPDACTYWC